MQKIGLFFGTFDPIHKGHLKLINFFIKNSDVEFIWLITTSQSPFKNQERNSIKFFTTRINIHRIKRKLCS